MKNAAKIGVAALAMLVLSCTMMTGDDEGAEAPVVTTSDALTGGILGPFPFSVNGQVYYLTDFLGLGCYVNGLPGTYVRHPLMPTQYLICRT